MAFIDVDEFDFSETMENELDSGNVVILKFSTQYCDACMSLGFELEELEENHKNVSILEIDCNESEGLAEEYGVIQVPSMAIYKSKNELIYNKTGIVLASDIEKIIGF